MEEEIYAHQHFGFSALQVTEERKHLIQIRLNKALDSLINKITTDAASFSELKREVSKNVIKCMEAELDEIAAVDKKYFHIPDHVLLSEDMDHLHNYTKEELSELEAQVEEYKRLFLQNSVMIKSLEQQEERFEISLPVLEKYLETFVKHKAIIELLNQNKLSHIQQLIRATKEVVFKLQQED